MFEKIALYTEPLEVLQYTTAKIEMSYFESSFLCGLIRKYRPCKIVEVGVATGVTSSVILNCLSKIGLKSEVISIDLAENYYRDSKLKTGFAIEELNPFIESNVNHRLLTGKVSADVLDQIGKDIDFLILDTTHSLPGEILDFIACFPYLTNDAIVVLHDTVYNHIHRKNHDPRNGFATKLLFDTVVAEKILCEDHTRIAKQPNITAFRCTDDTKKYINNVISSLTITWSYLPSREMLDAYRQHYFKHYSEEQLDCFDKAVQLNRHTNRYFRRNNVICRDKKENFYQQLNGIVKKIFVREATQKKIYQYTKRHKVKLVGIFVVVFLVVMKIKEKYNKIK